MNCILSLNETPAATVVLYGNLCKIVTHYKGFFKKNFGNLPIRKEGDIKGFSKDARRRLLKKLNQVDFKNRKNSFFTTLTYPLRYPTERNEYKSDLDTIIKRIKRAFGYIEILWCLEAQKRGAPHYHMILNFKNHIKLKDLREWFSKNWFEVAQRKWDIKDEKHFRAGTNCKRIVDPKQVMLYVSKYMTKGGDDILFNQGRYWGATRNWGELKEVVSLTVPQLIQFKRLMKRYIGRSNKRFADLITKMPNIDIFAHWEFALGALKWVQSEY